MGNGGRLRIYSKVSNKYIYIHLDLYMRTNERGVGGKNTLLSCEIRRYMENF